MPLLRPLGLPESLLPNLDPVSGTVLATGLAIVAVVVASRGLSRRTGIPYPVFLVVVGASVSFLPHEGQVSLDPRVVFLGFLPPLVYHAGIVSSPSDLRRNALPIGLGAFGLVLVTTFAVAGAARAAVPSLGWAAAFVLGAVLAPTDPVAATTVFARLGIPPHVTTVLEGEGLVNDGIALALFSVGIAGVATPTGFGAGLLTFVRVAAGGTAFGLAVGWLVSHLQRPIRDPASQIVVSLLVPYLAYLPADAMGLSGVLATLAAGLVIGQRPTTQVDPAGRIRIAEFWRVLAFLLESTLFVLVGLQLRHLLSAVGRTPVSEVVLLATLSLVVVTAVRLVWWLALPTLRWRPEGRLLDTGAVPWSERLALGWSGLRGAISLAAALSIPTVVSGHRFPGRDLTVFTTFCVIVATLVVQGTSLPWLLRRLGLGGGEVERRQRALAGRRCAEAALRVLDELLADEAVSEAAAGGLRDRYELRLDRIRQLDDESPDRVPPGALSPVAVERRLLAAQREVLHTLHRSGEISFAVMRDVRQALDFEEARLAE